MKKELDIEVIIDKKYKEPKITIYAQEENDEIKEIVNTINSIENKGSQFISAYLNGKIKMIDKNEILRIRRYGRQVYLETESETYILKNTITQLEEKLDSRKFIRISQSEIINAYKVVDLDVSVIGTIIIGFCNGVTTNVSRRYVKKVKEFFEN